MQYFTRELWPSAQNAAQLAQYERNWIQANNEYKAQLRKLEPRLSQVAYRFFLEADIHDGELLSLVLEDGSRPSPLSEPVRPWRRTRQHPVTLQLTVLDAADRLVWKLSYASLRRVVVDFPTSDPLFYDEGSGFGDWGYHELTDAGCDFLRHEVLFATGAVLVFEFKDLTVQSAPRPSATNSV